MQNEQGLANQPCGGFADRLVDLSDGELPAAEGAIVREHLEACPACRLTLARLDRSLVVLEQALVASEPVAAPFVHPLAGPPDNPPINPLVSRPAASGSTASRRGWVLAMAASAAAAALVVAAVWANRNSGEAGSGEISVPQVASLPQDHASAPTEPIQPAEQPKSQSRERDTTERIARRLALIEQVARLEASLAMLPDDPWFASQRTANERLLAGFRQAVEELSGEADPSQPNPSLRNEVL